MSELIALFRLAVAQSRLTIVVSLVYLIAIHLTINFVALGYGASVQRMPETVTAMIGLSSLPLMLMAFGLFGFNEHSDLSARASGYWSWLLRTPIANWKLALVPAAMKTVWVLVVSGAMVLTCWHVGSQPTRWLLPSIALSALMIAPSVLLWIPFRFNHTRAALFAVLFLPAYAWFLSWIAYAFDDQSSEVALLKGTPLAMWLVGCSGYACALWLSVYAVRTARCNAGGRTVEGGSVWTGRRDDAAPAAKIGFSEGAAKIGFAKPARISGFRSVARFELSKFRGTIGTLFLGTWAMMLAAAWLWKEIGPGSIVVTIIGFVFLLMFLFEWMYGTRDLGVLPNLLALAPIRTTTLAWTRQWLATLLALGVMSGILVAIGIWFAKGSIDRYCQTWNASMERVFEIPGAGMRALIAIIAVATLLIVRQSTWSLAAASLGNRRYVLYSFVARCLIAFALSSWLIYHFVQFRDWDAWTQWAWDRVADLPSILPWMLVIKLFVLTTSTASLYRSRLALDRTIGILILGYLIVAVVGGYACWRLLPGRGIELWHCLTVAAILVPISRIVIAPVCLAKARHG